MSFTPTEGQAAAIRMVEQLLARPEPAFAIMTGFAGTGKTTILKVISEIYGDPLVVTPTGKAALRVREATGVTARTIHKWLYGVQQDQKTGEPVWRLKKADDVDAPSNRLVVIDEASMVSKELWEDAWTIAVALDLRILVVGDRFQLGPVSRDEKPFNALTDLKTDLRTDLTEVVRQALESPIVRASMAIRRGESAAMEALIGMPQVPRRQLVDRFLKLGASRALLAWRNTTRHDLNREVRSAMTFPHGDIEAGEPLLVLANNYDLDRMNGEIVTFGGWTTPPGDEVAVRNSYKNLSVMARYGVALIEDHAAFVSPEEVFGYTKDMPAKTLSHWSRGVAKQLGYPRDETPPYLSANFGYCLTAHKAQGSEYDDVVVVIEEGRQPYSADGRRWVYTAVTRAKSTASICFY